MKTFEEKWTAWLDGELTGDELAEFEASLPDKAAAEAEKRDAQKLGAFLKEQLQRRRDGQRGVFPSSTARADRARCARRDALATKPARDPSWWPIGRLVWAGATSLAIFCRLHVFRHAREESNRSIAVSHADSERAGRSRGEPERDDLDV